MINAIEKTEQDNGAMEVAVLSRVSRVDVTEKVTFEQRFQTFQGGETANHPGVWGQSTQEREQPVQIQEAAYGSYPPPPPPRRSRRVRRGEARAMHPV